MKRIGILSGTFDPVHVGHVESALVARGALEIDQVLIFVEKNPSQKVGVADYKHRFAMLEKSLQDYQTLIPVKNREEHITTKQTLTYLKKHYPKAQAVLIIGSDILPQIETWENFDTLTKNMEIAVVLRNLREQKSIETQIKKLEKDYPGCVTHILPPVWSDVSSSKVKADIAENGTSEMVHKSVLEYIRKHKLYGF